MKSILLIGSLFLISAAFIIQTMDIGLSSNLPSKLDPGVPIEFEVTINKNGISGFSKFQMELPAGFTAELVDGKDGTFSFADQQIKIIWVSLPAENPFKVKFKLNTASDVKGIFSLKGIFSYVQDGERQNKEFTTEVNVGGATAVEGSSAPIATSTPAPVEAPVSNISFIRTISPEVLAPLQTCIVTLEINKGAVSGFGKITETIPVGFTAEQIETNGGIFSVSGNSVRFLWMTLPSDASYKISYKLTADGNVGKKEITGSFSYVKNDETLLVNTSTNYFDVPSPEAVAQATPDATPEKSEPAIQESAPVAASRVAPEEKAEQTASVNSTASASIGYRVQICATKKPVNTEYFVKNHNVTEKIYADMHEGWHKFTVGSYLVYGEARNHREAVKESYNIKNPFVTAYNNGARITVQEALMISKQTWVP